jgi:hypothetical protein
MVRIAGLSPHPIRDDGGEDEPPRKLRIVRTSIPEVSHEVPPMVGEVHESRRTRRYFRTYRRPVFVSTLASAEHVAGRVSDSDGSSVVVCAAKPPATAELVAATSRGWEIAAEGHYPTLRRDGVSIRWLGAWLGDRAAIEPRAAARFWEQFETYCGSVGPGAVPIGSPATLGRDLWLRTIPEGVTYPGVPAAVGEWLRATSGQGRVEVFAPAADCVRGVYEYDARLAYIGVLDDLPIGTPAHLVGVEARDWYANRPHGRARYRVEYEAPADWGRRPGIIPSEVAGWPLTGAGWCDAAAVHLAAYWGWRVRVVEAVVWERSASPFRPWARGILRVMASPPRGVDPAVWRAVWRSVSLHTIGAMHGSPRRRTRYGTTPPEGARECRPARGGGVGVFRWVEHEAPAWPETVHPEWTATIWERARLRLLSAPTGTRGVRVGALHVPETMVIALRNDAVYLTSPVEWPDDGRPGRFRLKKQAEGPFEWPRTIGQIAEVIA